MHVETELNGEPELGAFGLSRFGAISRRNVPKTVVAPARAVNRMVQRFGAFGGRRPATVTKLPPTASAAVRAAMAQFSRQGLLSGDAPELGWGFHSITRAVSHAASSVSHAVTTNPVANLISDTASKAKSVASTATNAVSNASDVAKDAAKSNVIGRMAVRAADSGSQIIDKVGSGDLAGALGKSVDIYSVGAASKITDPLKRIASVASPVANVAGNVVLGAVTAGVSTEVQAGYVAAKAGYNTAKAAVNGNLNLSTLKNLGMAAGSAGLAAAGANMDVSKFTGIAEQLAKYKDVLPALASAGMDTIRNATSGSDAAAGMTIGQGTTTSVTTPVKTFVSVSNASAIAGHSAAGTAAKRAAEASAANAAAAAGRAAQGYGEWMAAQAKLKAAGGNSAAATTSTSTDTNSTSTSKIPTVAIAAAAGVAALLFLL